MKELIEFKGASGAAYRFRVWPEKAAHLPIAGNYVFLKETPAGFEVLLVGATNNLSLARAEWNKVRDLGATHVFTRLNVARAARAAEHEDLVAAYQPVVVSDGVG